MVRRFQSTLSFLLHGVGRVLLPPVCPLCRGPVSKDGLLACRKCAADIREIVEPFCSVCGIPFSGAGPCHPCPRCLADEPPFEELRAWGLFRGGLLEAIRSIKYRRNLGARPALEELALRGFDRHWGSEAFSAVVPVPAHATTLQRRGFDLPALLAGRISRDRAISFRPAALAKVRLTEDLVGLGLRDRRRAVEGAYAPREALDGGVLLVDDVATSTSTARACAQACLDAGATWVRVLALARTPTDGT